MTLWLFEHVLAAMIVAAVCCRLAILPRSEPSLQCRARWHGWVLSHVLIGVGAFARLFNIESVAVPSIMSGMVILFVVRWQRRRSDA